MNRFLEFFSIFLPRHIRPSRTIPVFVSGLVEAVGRDGSRVCLQPGYGLDFVFEQISDENGHVRGSIDKEYVDRNLLLRVFDVGYEFLDHEIIVRPYGVFAAVRLKKDDAYVGTSQLDYDGSSTYLDSWDSDGRYMAAQQEIHDKIRNIRQGSFFAWILEVALTACSIVGLAFVDPIVAIVGGGAVWVIVHFWLGPKAAGTAN